MSTPFVPRLFERGVHFSRLSLAGGRLVVTYEEFLVLTMILLLQYTLEGICVSHPLDQATLFVQWHDGVSADV